MSEEVGNTMDIIFCWVCGVKILPSANYCHSCGKDIRASGFLPDPAPVSTRGDNASDPPLSALGDAHDGQSELDLKSLVTKVLGIEVEVRGTFERFNSTGWTYRGRTDIGCFECGQMYEVFRKPYKTSLGDYEYWGIVCPKCLTCENLSGMTVEASIRFRRWATGADSSVIMKKTDTTKSNKIPVKKPKASRGSAEERPSEENPPKIEEPKVSPKFSDGKAAKKNPPRDRTAPLLPLPGDPGSTRRPGKKREYYRTGEEALLRDAARKHKWW